MEVGQKSKSYQAIGASPRARNTMQSRRKRFPNTNIFFGDQPQRAAEIDN